MGSFVELKSRALEGAVPLTAMLELSYACNHRCGFCYNPNHGTAPAMSTRDWTAVLDDLRLLGTLFVTLTGGEPLLHPGFVKIARAARERHFAVTILSNGSLIDEAMARTLGELNPFTVELSLHGASAATHDGTTGRSGSFAALWRAVDQLRDQDVDVGLKTPVTRRNEDEIEAMSRLATRHHLRLRFDPFVTVRDDGDQSPMQYQASAEGLTRLLALLEAKDRLPRSDLASATTNCGLGRLTVAVDPDGNVFPCIQWRHSSIGNVRRVPLRELWPDSRCRKEAAATSDETRTWLLEARSDLSGLQFCPAEAILRAGSPETASSSFAHCAAQIRSWQRPGR